MDPIVITQDSWIARFVAFSKMAEVTSYEVMYKLRNSDSCSLWRYILSQIVAMSVIGSGIFFASLVLGAGLWTWIYLLFISDVSFSAVFSFVSIVGGYIGAVMGMELIVFLAAILFAIVIFFGKNLSNSFGRGIDKICDVISKSGGDSAFELYQSMKNKYCRPVTFVSDKRSETWDF